MAELKAGWRRWRFDQMATSITERVDDPKRAGVEYYVGLEHLDSDSLKIRRWGSPADVSATKLLFEPGDIIFGRRRAYQRKLGVAEFRGIASAHSLVLRAKPEVVLPEFLPFFMQSDIFMERAQEISVGSLSPTINWRTLAKQEFALPPLEEQRRMVRVLQKLDKVVWAATNAIQQADQTRLAATEDFLRRQQDPVALDEILLDTTYGSSTRATRDRNKAVPILRVPNVWRGKINLDDLKFVELDEKETQRYTAHEGDILLVRTNGNPDYVGRCVVVRDLPETHVFASYLIRLSVDETKADPTYVAALLNSPSCSRSLRGSVRSSAGNYNINTKGIRRQRIPLPDLQTQRALVDRLDEISRTEFLLTIRAKQHEQLKRALFKVALS